MKIDKVVFTCSVEFSPFWNIQAKLYKKGLGIEPVCLLYGKKSDTDMTEDYGQVIEVPPIPDFPLIQLLWAKFHFPLTEPNTTWMIGDLDLVPLQREHFVERIAPAPDDAMLHLNAQNQFFSVGCRRLAKDAGLNGMDLPGHYFVAKGALFNVFTQGKSIEENLRYIFSSDRYGRGPLDGLPKGDSQYYFVFEEHYGSELLAKACLNGFKLVPYYYNNGNNRQRIDRAAWTGSDYTYDSSKLAEGQFVDIHCARPYAIQKDALYRVIKQSPLSHCA
jgi:hypothetical protein